mmetsp:Transcript_14916/g.18750  ORF Transcript_14916/g.18750 Transcript_14916/m.18750 type:complete len:227 (-) Transcript_14916:1394-2074(-)
MILEDGLECGVLHVLVNDAELDLVLVGQRRHVPVPVLDHARVAPIAGAGAGAPAHPLHLRVLLFVLADQTWVHVRLIQAWPLNLMGSLIEAEFKGGPKAIQRVLNRVVHHLIHCLKLEPRDIVRNRHSFGQVLAGLIQPASQEEIERSEGSREKHSPRLANRGDQRRQGRGHGPRSEQNLESCPCVLRRHTQLYDNHNRIELASDTHNEKHEAGVGGEALRYGVKH